MKEIKFRNIRKEEIDLRVGSTKKENKNDKNSPVVGFQLLGYKDARVDADILDTTVGCANWQCKYYQVKNTLMCSVGINVNYDEPNKEPYWIWKDDAGDESNEEAIKGEASDSFKRACFRWNICRTNLYNLPFIWINVTKDNTQFSHYIVDEIEFDEKGLPTKLVIINEKTKQVVYSYGVGAKSGYNKPKTTEKGNVTLNEVSSSVNSMEEMIPQDTFEEDLRVVSAYKNEKYKTEDGKNNFNAYLTRVFGKTNLADFTTEELHKLALAVKKAQGR